MTTREAVADTITPAREESQATTLEGVLGAAFIASGIGSTVLGLTVVGAEASEAIKTALNWYGPVGPLSGKTSVAIIAFFLSWALLHFSLKGSAVKLTTSFIIAAVLVGIGLLLTFPPIFMLFTAE